MCELNCVVRVSVFLLFLFGLAILQLMLDFCIGVSRRMNVNATTRENGGDEVTSITQMIKSSCECATKLCILQRILLLFSMPI